MKTGKLGLGIFLVWCGLGHNGIVMSSKPDMRDITYATTTKYWEQKSHCQSNGKVFPDVNKQCKLIQVNGVYRHGSRYPTAGGLTDLVNVLKKLQSLHEDDIPKWLKTFSYSYNATNADQLAPTGAKELKGIGERTRKLAVYLPTTYDANAYRFEHTWKKRTKDSAIA